MALRVGTENKPKLYAAIGLGALVVILAIVQLPKFFGGSTAPTPARTQAATETTAAAPQAAGDTAHLQASPYPHDAVRLSGASALDPTLHPELMEQAENTTYRGNGRNIFSPDSAAPAPVHIEKPKAFRPQAVIPQGPPPPPQIDLKYYGYASTDGGPRQIFLLHGDDIFVAHEGDIVDRRYRVVSIRPFSVEIEDIPYHNTQSLPLSQN